MSEVKPSARKRLAKLPPQESATDTSNWDDRNIAAPTIDRITKKGVVRDTVFIENKLDTSGLILDQESRKRTKKTSK